MRVFKSLIERIEGIPVNPVVFLLAGEVWALLRMFLEDRLLSIERISYYMYMHGISTFTFTFLTGTFLLSLIAGQRVEKTIKITGMGYFLLLIPPVIDGLWAHRVMIYKYADPFRPEMPSCTVTSFLFSLEDGFCAGPGIRIELYLIAFLSALYTYVKKRSVLRSFVAFLMVPAMFLFVLYQEVLMHRTFTSVLDSALYFMRFYKSPTFEKLTVTSYLLFSIIVLGVYSLRRRHPDSVVTLLIVIVFYFSVSGIFPGVRTIQFFDMLLTGVALASFVTWADIFYSRRKWDGDDRIVVSVAYLFVFFVALFTLHVTVIPIVLTWGALLFLTAHLKLPKFLLALIPATAYPVVLLVLWVAGVK